MNISNNDDDFFADEDYSLSDEEERFQYTRLKDKNFSTPNICMFGHLNLTAFFPALTERVMAIPQLRDKLWCSGETGDLHLPLFIRNYKDGQGRKRVGIFTGDKVSGLFIGRLKMPYETKSGRRRYPKK